MKVRGLHKNVVLYYVVTKIMVILLYTMKEQNSYGTVKQKVTPKKSRGCYVYRKFIDTEEKD